MNKGATTLDYSLPCLKFYKRKAMNLKHTSSSTLKPKKIHVISLALVFRPPWQKECCMTALSCFVGLEIGPKLMHLGDFESTTESMCLVAVCGIWICQATMLHPSLLPWLFVECAETGTRGFLALVLELFVGPKLEIQGFSCRF